MNCWREFHCRMEFHPCLLNVSFCPLAVSPTGRNAVFLPFTRHFALWTRFPHRRPDFPVKMAGLPVPGTAFPHPWTRLPYRRPCFPHLRTRFPCCRPRLPHGRPAVPSKLTRLPVLRPAFPHRQPRSPPAGCRRSRWQFQIAPNRRWKFSATRAASDSIFSPRNSARPA